MSDSGRVQEWKRTRVDKVRCKWHPARHPRIFYIVLGLLTLETQKFREHFFVNFIGFYLVSKCKKNDPTLNYFDILGLRARKRVCKGRLCVLILQEAPWRGWNAPSPSSREETRTARAPMLEETMTSTLFELVVASQI